MHGIRWVVVQIDVKRAWVLYDVANSAYILLLTSLIPIYFHDIASDGGLTEAEYLSFWSAATTLVTVAMLFIGPAMGSLSDRKGWRKPIFMGLVLTGVLTCVALGVPTWWVLFLLVLCISRIAFNASLVIYDGMLIDVAQDHEMDDLSSKGYAMGYIGSCIPFVLCMVLVVLSDFMDSFPTIMTFYDAVFWSLVITAAWWLLFSVPLFKKYEQVHYNEVRTRTVKENLSYFASTIKDISTNKAMLYFLLAYFFYIDGVNTIIEMATAFGESMNLTSIHLLGALLVMQVVAFPMTIVMNKAAEKYGTHRIIWISILGYICISAYGLILDNTIGFYALAVCIGFFQGTIQALSRSYFGRMVPKSKTGEYFGILDVFGKGSTIIGTASISIFTALTGSVRTVPIVLLAVFIIGYLMFTVSVRTKVYDSEESGV